MKKFFSALLPGLCLALLLCLTAAGANKGDVTILIDGVPLDSGGAYINENGTTMVPLRALAEALGLAVTWDPETRTAAVISEEMNPAQTAPIVMLDPGHGGESVGAAYSGVEEKNLNLDITKKTAALLEAAGVDVHMTRTGDWDVDLYERTGMAARAGADLFVSIHCNASLTNPEATGIYTAAYAEESAGWTLAETLRTSVMAAAGAGDMGTEARPNLAVLRTAAMPAALVECGYMSTPEELSLLTWPDYQDRLARGIADGVLAYLDLSGQYSQRG